MLKIRLSRWWKHKRPFFRIVLTEHTKPVKSGYKDILWWFDPIQHKSEIDIQKAKEYIAKWTQLSSRVAKLMYDFSKDSFFKQFYTETQRTRKVKNPKEEPVAQAPVVETPVQEVEQIETQEETIQEVVNEQAEPAQEQTNTQETEKQE